MTIMVSAGHSNTDPGATNGGLREADHTVQMRNAVAHYLKEAGVSYTTDGIGSDNKPLTDAVKLARGKYPAVEFHFNAGPASAKGIEVLANPKDKQLAQDLAAAVHSITGSPLRGDKGYKAENSGQHSRLAFVRAGGMIVELEFITNNDAMKTYLATYWKVAKAISDVLIKYHKE